MKVDENMGFRSQFLIKGRFDFGSPPFGFAFKAMHCLSLNVTINELVGNGYPLNGL
jgi:hypothetical protein